ncbi:MAG: hypothetical protein ACRCX7_12645 [Cetobacterium sp.]|uniref:hypothetical protein n=1 Tax=Cetobacterium sp. TaxID=2071632 RepID=UPI003F2DCDBC
MKFIFDFEKDLVIFEDGTTCTIENDSFNYKGIDFTLESDVEKDLSYTFNEEYVNMTEEDEDFYIVWTYNGGYELSCEGLFDTFDEAQDKFTEALESYLEGSYDAEVDAEMFMFNSRIEEV